MMGEAVYFLVVTARSLVSPLAPAAAAVVVAVVAVVVVAAAAAVVVAYEPGAVPAGPAPRVEGTIPNICAYSDPGNMTWGGRRGGMPRGDRPGGYMPGVMPGNNCGGSAGRLGFWMSWKPRSHLQNEDVLLQCSNLQTKRRLYQI